MDARLEEYLDTIPAAVARAKARAALNKTVNAGGFTTEAELVLRAVDRGGAELTYRFGYGKKQDGLRLPTKPKWSIWSGDTGHQISKTAAAFACYLLHLDIEELIARGDAAYEVELERCR